MAAKRGALPLDPGTIAIGTVYQGCHGCRPKRRPVVVMRERGSHVDVLGLTSLRVYENGRPRTPVRDWKVAGLYGRGYLWSPSPVPQLQSDLSDPIGHLSDRDRAILLGDMPPNMRGDYAA
jgi:hypothetical protein